MADVIHYEITGTERQRKLGSTGHFGPDCLCGNGNFHAKRVQQVAAVTCEPCLALLAEKPTYLNLGGYRMPCNEPDFQQSVPRGRWTRIPDPLFPGQYRYRNDDTGETVLVPAIWYNGTPKERAGYLRYCADRAEEGAARIEAEGRAWSAGDAARQRASAARLREQAAIYEASPASVAGHVEGVE